MEVNPIIPITNRPGCFAVLHQEAAQRITQGYMKLYERNGLVIAETITRNKIPLAEIDEEVRFVYIALDEQGRITTNVA
jgi:hypothetical protein